MKKLFFCFAMLLGLALTANASETNSSSAQNPVEQFTGQIWQTSKPENKQAFLFGIDTAIAVEKAINEQVNSKTKDAKKAKKVSHTLSVFEKNWMDAFKDMSREQIVKAVDDWYAANPEKLDRPVLEVIWYEIIVPKVGKTK